MVEYTREHRVGVGAALHHLGIAKFYEDLREYQLADKVLCEGLELLKPYRFIAGPPKLNRPLEYLQE